MLARLVGFDTTSRNSNLALIEFVRDYLDRLGVASELVFDDSGGKANLLATIGPAERPGWCCPVTPTWCRSTARTGRAIPSAAARGTAGSTAAAPPT